MRSESLKSLAPAMVTVRTTPLTGSAVSVVYDRADDTLNVPPMAPSVDPRRVRQTTTIAAISVAMREAYLAAPRPWVRRPLAAKTPPAQLLCRNVMLSSAWKSLTPVTVTAMGMLTEGCRCGDREQESETVQEGARGRGGGGDHFQQMSTMKQCHHMKHETMTLTLTLKYPSHHCHLLMNPQNLPKMVTGDLKEGQIVQNQNQKIQRRPLQNILCPTTWQMPSC